MGVTRPRVHFLERNGEVLTLLEDERHFVASAASLGAVVDDDSVTEREIGERQAIRRSGAERGAAQQSEQKDG